MTPVDDVLAVARLVPVFPCRPDKRPATANGFHDATQDPATIRAWWTATPNAFVGMPTGRASGVFVVDLDRAKHGEPDGTDWLADYEAAHGPLATLTATTPSGGEHLYFTMPAGRAIRNSAGQVAPNVDTRGDGGYVITWPSPGYEFVDGIDTPQEAPAALLELLTGTATTGVNPSVVSAGRWRPLDRAALNDQDRAALEALEQLGGHSAFVGADGSVHVTRPGKRAGTSATVGHLGPGIAKVFTGNWPTLAAGVYDADQLDRIAGGDVSSPVDAGPAIVVRSIPDPFAIEPPRFLIRGFMPAETWGELAGAKKTIKSYLTSAAIVGGALGTDVLGAFPVAHPFRTLMFTGEGGEALWLRRLDRIVHAYDATIDDVRPMIRYSTHTAAASSTVLRDTIRRELDTTQPDLVVLDPWYAFASLEADARNLYETGRVLNDLRELVCQDGTSLLIVNHFNQTGTGTGLERITMAGHAEWCDSWWLVNHRTHPDVGNGRFKLTMQIGSRQWGGNTHNVDFTIGRFDPETGTHDGPITWQVHETETGATPGHDLADVLVFIPKAVAACKAAPGPLSQRQLLPMMGKGTDERKRAAIAYAVDAGCITVEDGPKRRVDHSYGRDWTHADADQLRSIAGLTFPEAQK